MPEWLIHDTQVAPVFKMLLELLGDGRAVAARLVGVHGSRIRLLLHGSRHLPEVASCFPLLRTGSLRVLEEAQAKVRRHGARRASVALASKYGFTVFDTLNRHAAQREIRPLLHLPPRREPHRPEGSTSRDLVAFVVAEIIDLGIPRAELLRGLGRNPKSTSGVWPQMSETSDSKWFRSLLRRGRAFQKKPETSADALLIAFLRSYIRGLPRHERLSVLCPFLVDGMVPLSRLLIDGVRASKLLFRADERHAGRALLAEALCKGLSRALPPSSR
jgi:hypothetical protein